MTSQQKTSSERSSAQALSAEIDRMLSRDPNQTGSAPLFETARRLGKINALMPPVPQSLRQRITKTVMASTMPQMTMWQRIQPALLGALMATVVLLFLWMITPGGKIAVAEMLSLLQLGQTWVEVTPTTVPADAKETPSLRVSLPDLLAVETQMGRRPAVPQPLSEGYDLREITAVSYPDLPAWIAQPFYFVLCYGYAENESVFCLKEYHLLLRGFNNISGLSFSGNIVMEQVSVSGVEAALLTATGQETQYIIVWEKDGLLLELQSSALSKEELLAIAQTVR